MTFAALMRRRVRPVGQAPEGPQGTVAMQIERVAAGSGATVCYGVVPLAPGQLQPGQPARLEIGGAEVAARLTPWDGRHPDGSVAALRVQVTRTLAQGVPESATVVLNAAQAVTPPQAQAFAWPVGTFTPATWRTGALADGWAVPTSAAQCCASRLYGDVIPRSQTVTGASAWESAYWPLLDTVLPAHVDAVNAANYNNGSESFTMLRGYVQYDRPYTLWQHFAMQPSVARFDLAMRACALARDMYFDAQAANWNWNEEYGASRWFLCADAAVGDPLMLSTMQQEGRVMVSSGATWQGLDASRTFQTLLDWANGVNLGGNDPGVAANISITGSSDRLQTYEALRLFTLVRCGRGAQLGGDGTRTVQQWLDDHALRLALAPQWSAGTNAAAKWRNTISTTFGGSVYVAAVQNFQMGLRVCALAEMLPWLSAGTVRDTVRARLRSAVDYLWSEYWPNGSGARDTLYYTDVDASHGSRNDVALSANGWYATAFAWRYAQGDGSVWRDRAALLMAGAVGTPRDAVSGPYVGPTLSNGANLTLTAVGQKDINQVLNYSPNARGYIATGDAL